jgi:hypothetical protein
VIAYAVLRPAKLRSGIDRKMDFRTGELLG